MKTSAALRRSSKGEVACQRRRKLGEGIWVFILWLYQSLGEGCPEVGHGFGWRQVFSHGKSHEGRRPWAISQ